MSSTFLSQTKLFLGTKNIRLIFDQEPGIVVFREALPDL